MSSQAKDQTIECAATVQPTELNLREKIWWLLHHLTKYLPRKLPETSQEFENLKAKLVKYYGLEDSADNWATVAGQITSAPPTSMRKSYGDLANAARRKKVNLIAQNQKILAYAVLEGKLEKAAMELVQYEKLKSQAQANQQVQGGAHNLPEPVQPLQTDEGAVVQPSH